MLRWLTSPAVTAGLLVLAVAIALMAVRAGRRDTEWIRHRASTPLDWVPVRAKAKRIHLGLRLASFSAVLVLAAMTVLVHGRVS